jgi:hypothetical protein
VTVEAGTQAYVQYTGTGTRVFYEYDFIMLDDSAVYVIVDGQPTEVTQQATGIVFDVAPVVGAEIVIYRITDITQLTDWQSFEAFHGVKTEDAQDKLILLKQEAAIFRAQMNLFADHQLDRVTLVNDKGTDADIFYWNELEAGVFGGEVTQNMPNAGAVVEKPEDFAYFQWGDTTVLTQTLTTTLYPLQAQDAIELSVTLAAGALWPIPVDNMDLGAEFISGTLTEILLNAGPYPDNMDLGVNIINGVLVTILLNAGPYPDDMDLGVSFVDGLLEAKLVSIYAPDEALELSVTLASGSMTPV